MHKNEGGMQFSLETNLTNSFEGFGVLTPPPLGINNLPGAIFAIVEL
jgi:hypothetical protein